ncbi:MAG: poly-beta-1,6-N-acetyl-D-glucosamine N-deacetylase PgaB [Burkholderiales bacterium]|nr:poly-beta-1,6-N-acetyl-D-glucosamine N-deacetylase PgaB [Burkholderiales bacterium]
MKRSLFIGGILNVLRAAGVVLAFVWMHAAFAQSLSNAVKPAGDLPQSFRVLCYHDIRDNVRDSFKSFPEPTAVDTQDLIKQFSWLQENGYVPVSLQQIIDARAGRAKLPEKAILLTFDDGYKSVYTKVFPLLKQFKFPAVIAIVGEWIQTPADEKVKYGDDLMPRDQFANWDELREMVASGLVEVASHSHGLHKGIQANPQGNMIAAAVARTYSPHNGAYEDDRSYADRIQADLKQNADLIEREMGLRPRAMVWPYGMYNQDGARWSGDVGMPITMNLEPGPNVPEDPLWRIRRSLITFNFSIADLMETLHLPSSYAGVAQPLERVVHVDLDYIYDPDPKVSEANLSNLLDRILRMRPSTVYLQAYADHDGDGVADALYFPNRHLPMRADLFSRVAWQLRTRVGVRVYAWMPVLAFKLPASAPAASRTVQVLRGAPESALHGRYHRLSPFDSLARQTVTEIYEDLGKHAVFAGVLFHDDATLSDYEDASPAALAVYRERWQLPDSLEAIRSDPALRRRWAERKTAHLNEFTVHLANTLRRYHPALLTARNLYAPPVLNAEAEDWFAQSFPSFLSTYDFTAVMAMPYMEGAKEPDRWLNELIGKVKEIPGALGKTVFELQSRDWKTNQPIPASTLVAQMRRLNLEGARHFGYYPDDFHGNMPDEEIIKPIISVETRAAWR